MSGCTGSWGSSEYRRSHSLSGDGVSPSQFLHQNMTGRIIIESAWHWPNPSVVSSLGECNKRSYLRSHPANPQGLRNYQLRFWWELYHAQCLREADRFRKNMIRTLTNTRNSYTPDGPLVQILPFAPKPFWHLQPS